MSEHCAVCGKQRATEAEHDRLEAEPYARDHPDRCWEWCDEDCWEDEGGGDSIMVLVRRLRAEADRLESIRAAIREYHEALDQRRSGVVAQGRAFDKIVTILDMPWRPGGGS